MKLNQLLERMEARIVTGSKETEVNQLVYDSRKVQKGDLFVCIRGAVSDGHQYISQVLKKGAGTLVVMEDVWEKSLEECRAYDVTLVSVKDTRLALACLSAAYFGYPAEELITIGITGTKGKTTTTYMVRSILENSGDRKSVV